MIRTKKEVINALEDMRFRAEWGKTACNHLGIDACDFDAIIDAADIAARVIDEREDKFYEV